MARTPQGRQLYQLTARDYLFPNFVDEGGRLHTRPADNIPLLNWPDGSWCHDANRFMLELFNRGLSRKNRGGSLMVAAAQVTHLIRYCWDRRCDPIDLSDSQFSEMMRYLQTEKRVREPTRKRRDANSVISIGRTCLAMLDSVGRHSGVPEFVASEGRIRARRLTHQVKLGGARSDTRTVSYWSHASFPNPDPLKKRLPIATSNIERMRKAVSQVSTTSHQRFRRHVTLKLLEITGARRGEIALIRTESVQRAVEMDQPMLRIPTLKKRGNTVEYRFVPLSRADLAFIRQYVEVHRRSVVRRKLEGQADHGLLLVNGRTGQPLTPGGVTQEVRKLAQAAGIQEKACPHMFRHRFITKLFVALIEQYHVENADQFRRLLLTSEQFKVKVAEWTGQSSLESVDRYISLAFDEIGNYKKAYNLVSATLALDSFMGTIDAERDAIDAGDQPILILERLKAQIAHLRSDLAAARDSGDVVDS